MKVYDAAIEKNSFLKDGLYETIQNCLPKTWERRETQMWIGASRTDSRLPEQGWKGHVSALWYEAEKLAMRVIPVLTAHGCAFKLVKNRQLLRLVNDCHYPMSGANKFITFYPDTEKQFVEIMGELFEKLQDFEGPRIYTDMQCRGCQCLHYRYGAFLGIVKYDEAAQKLKYYMRDKSGRLTEDVRKPWYQEPKWVENPFRATGDNRFIMVSPQIRGTPLEHYRMEKLLSQANKGNVYLAVFRESGKRVILKEARPRIAYSESQSAISCLKKEYGILCRMQEKGITPKPLELFSCNGNWYLAEEWIEGKSLTRYSASHHTLEEKEAAVRNLFSAMDVLYQEGILCNDLSPNNIMVMPDGRVRLIDLESAEDSAKGGGSGIFATKGFCNTDKNKKETPYSRDLFGLAMSVLCLYLGTALRFSGDESEGGDTRPVVDKVIEQMALAVEERKLPEEVRNVVYALLLKSSQRIEEKPVFFGLLNRELPFPATKRWRISLDNAGEACCSFLEGLHRAAAENLQKQRKRLWDSTAFGRTTNILNIQHGVAGIGGCCWSSGRARVLRRFPAGC